MATVNIKAERTHRGRSFLQAALAASALLGLLLVVDYPGVQLAAALRARGISRQLLDMLEAFGDGVGVILILVAFATLAETKRHLLPRLAVASLGAGIAADVVKLMVSRTRPRVVDFDNTTVLETFEGVLPLISAGSDGQGFPSAHTATAAGLAVGLAWVFPQGRRLFLALTAGVALQRMSVYAHFPSDVVVGGAVGFCWARLCLPDGAWGAAFQRLEDRLSNSAQTDVADSVTHRRAA